MRIASEACRMVSKTGMLVSKAGKFEKGINDKDDLKCRGWSVALDTQAKCIGIERRCLKKVEGPIKGSDVCFVCKEKTLR